MYFQAFLKIPIALWFQETVQNRPENESTVLFITGSFQKKEEGTVFNLHAAPVDAKKQIQFAWELVRINQEPLNSPTCGR